MNAEKLGLFIADLRKEKNMTQADLAHKLNVTVQAVSKWERGKGLPDINTIEPLAKELNVSVLEIMKATRMDSHIPQEEMNSATRDIFAFLKSMKKFQTRKYFVCGLLGLLVLTLFLWVGSQVYGYYHPYLRITCGTAHSEDFFKTNPLVIIQEKSLLGYSNDIKQKLAAWSEATTAMEISFGEQYEKPMSILNHFEIKNGKTYIYYKGFAKSKTTGEMISISETVVLDFVLTENLP